MSKKVIEITLKDPHVVEFSMGFGWHTADPWRAGLFSPDKLDLGQQQIREAFGDRLVSMRVIDDPKEDLRLLASFGGALMG